MHHKTTRRQLLYQSAIAAISIPFAAENLPAKPLKTVGLQLYTLRGSIGKDPEGVLRKVSETGYKEVETFGMANQIFEIVLTRRVNSILPALT